MNNFLFEAVCSWSSGSVRKPFKKAFGNRSEKVIPHPVLTEASR